MLYAPVTTASATEVSDAPLFVGFSRSIDRTIKHAGYATDDFTIHAIFVPVVYQCRATGAFLAAYMVTAPFTAAEADSDRFIINAHSVHADAQSAALAADIFADKAAQAASCIRPAPSAEDLAMIEKRGRVAFSDNEMTQAEIRRRCRAALSPRYRQAA